MAVTANKLITPQSVQTATAICTVAKTTYNDATNAVRLLPAASVPNGALVKRIYAQTRATITATQLQLYRSPDTGTTLILSDTALYPAYTMAQTTRAPKAYFGDMDGSPTGTNVPYSDSSPLRVEGGEELWVAIGVNLVGGVVFVVEYEAY